MKALLKKDILTARRYLRIAAFAPLIFAVAGAIAEKGGFFLTLGPLMSVGNIISLISYDERFHWDRTCDMLPVSRRTQVTEKYVLLLLYMGITLLLCGGAALIRFGRPDAAQLQLVMLALSLLPISFLLPLVFRLGVEKARLLYYIAVGVCVALGMQFSSIRALHHGPAWGSAAVLAMLLLFVLSWRLSVSFYERREL